MIITNPLLFVPFPMPFFNDHDAPVKVTISSAKVIQTTRTVGGYNFSHWGDQPERMDVSGAVLLLPGFESLGLLSLSVLKQLYRLDKKHISNILNANNRIIPAATAAVAVTAAVGQETINNTKAFQLYSSEKAGKMSPTSLVSSGLQSLASITGSILRGLSIAAMTKRIIRSSPKDLSVTYIYHDGYIYSGHFTRFSYTRDANDVRKANYNFNFAVDWSTESLFADKLLQLSKGKQITGLGVATT